MFDNPDENLGESAETSEISETSENTKVGITEMEFSQMTSFPGHIFRLYEGQQLDDMVESIRQFGILLPIILWYNDDNAHVILSGHNRVNAAQRAGLTRAPVVIKTNLSHEEAVLIVTETNLRQRSFSDLSHSERALCLSQHYEAMKNQGRRSDLISEIGELLNPHDNSVQGTCAEPQHKLKNRDKIGKDYGLSKNKVARYIRLATLDPALLAAVDSGEIAFLAAYDLSFIDRKSQSVIADSIKSGRKVDMKIAALLRDYHEKSKLTEKAIEQILSGEKSGKSKNKSKYFSLKSAVVGKFFTDGQSKSEIEEIIEKALSQYFSSREVVHI
jgi:ParB family chromosome partitioning protein